MSDNLVKQIKISNETYEELTNLSKNKNDTFNSLIQMCIQAYKRELKRKVKE